jgi:hypothetical protein
MCIRDSAKAALALLPENSVEKAKLEDMVTKLSQGKDVN